MKLKIIYENMLRCFIRISRHRSHSTSSSGSSSEESDTDSSDSDSDSSGSDTNNNTKDKKSIKSPLKSPSSSPKVRVLLGENCKIKSQLQSIVGCHLSIKIESRLWLHVLESRIVRRTSFKNTQVQSVLIFFKFVHPCILLYLQCY